MTYRVDLNRLTREMVSARLADINDPAALAADVAGKTIALGLKASPGLERLDLIREVCSGAMAGLLVGGERVPAGAAGILSCVVDAASTGHIDPCEAMTAALRGIAEISRAAPEGQLYDIGCALEERFHGAGDAFRRLLQERSAMGSLRS